MKILRIAIGLAAAPLLAEVSLACLGPPPSFNESADTLIGRSKRVVLARAIAAELSSDTPDLDDIPVRYKFSVVEVLAGSVPKIFEVTGTPHLLPFEVSDFKAHSEPAFWEAGGRAMFYPDCEFHPSFAIGRTYLMFLDKPYQSRSFELIRIPPAEPERDKWLQYVRSKLVKVHMRP